MVVRQHDGRTSGQVRELLPVHRGPHRIDVGGAGGFNRVHPHVEANIMRFHRVVGHTIFAHALFPRGNPLGIGLGIGGLEIVPGSQVSDEVRRVETGKLFFPDREGHDRNVIRRDTGRRQFLVEADIRVTVDRADNAYLFAVGAKCHDVSHDLRPVGMSEGRVVDEDVFRRNALLLQVGLQNVVRGPWVDIVSAQKCELFDTKLFEEVVSCRDRLLVGSCTGVKDVLGRFFAFVLNWVEEKAVQFFDHR